MKKTTLTNGLEIISHHIPSVQSVTLSVFVGAGSFQEARYPKGAAHFLEHMLFKGTKKRTSFQINAEMDNIGAFSNAYTDREITKYYHKVPYDQWKIGMDVLLDMIFHSTLPEEEIEKERMVILEEIKMYQDDPSGVAFDTLDEVLYPNQPERLAILGSPESVKSMTRNDLFSFLEEFYQPNNLKIVATGNIDHDALVSFVESFDLSRSGKTTKDPYPAISLSFDGSTTVLERDLQQSHIAWATNGPVMKSDDTIAMSVLTNILSGGMSSRLFQKIRDQKGLAYSVFAGRTSTLDTGMLYGYIGTDPEKVEEAKSAVKEELLLLQNEPLSHEEMQKAINYTKGTYMLKMESPDSINEYQGKSALFNLEADFQSYIDKVASVTQEQIQEIAKRYIDIDKMVFVEVGPKKLA